MKSYWDTRFLAEGKIWGDKPSRTAEHALLLFRENGVTSVLVPGSGYGRNTRLFSLGGMKVTGIEISSAAHGWAQEFDPAARHINASILEPDLGTELFDAVYCFNVLHLFLSAERQHLLNNCLEHTRPGGLLYFTVFSEKESSYGKGNSPEPDTYESKPGRPAHYFSDDDIRRHFSMTEILETGLTTDEENHGEGPHTHLLRYLYARKPQQ